MSGISTIFCNGKSIVYVDVANLSVASKGEIVKNLRAATELVKQKPPKSVLIVTNVGNIKFDTEVVDAFKRYASDNTPYIKASALVGVGGLQKVILNTVKLMTGRDYYVARDLEDAKEWVTR